MGFERGILSIDYFLIADSQLPQPMVCDAENGGS
jgi:hypothetical protein